MALIQLNLPAPPTPKAMSESARYNLAGLTAVFSGIRTHSGQYVSESTALRASAVLACIRILSEDLSQLPLNIFRQTPRGSILATDHSLYRLLHDSPNQWQTSMELRESLIIELLLHGQSFVEKSFDGNGIAALYPLATSRVSYISPIPQSLPPDTPLRWMYSDPQNGPRILLSDDLWRSSLLSAMGTIDGRSIVLLAREAIGLALAAEEQGARLFSNGVQTDVVFKAKDTLDDDSRNNLREALRRSYSGAGNAWIPLLLEDDLDVQKLGLTAQESQYLESRNFQTSEIARLFRIPDVLLGISNGKTATFASAEQFFQSYVRNTLQPWTVRIEQTIQRDLIAPSDTGITAKHDLDALLRADLMTRYNAHAVGIQNRFLTPNEARAYENLPLLPGLDEPITTPASNGGVQPTNSLALQLAKNCVAHEEKLLADGKAPADVYGKLLPGYLRDKAGLSAVKCAEYCAARLAGASDGVELLKKLLIAG